MLKIEMGDMFGAIHEDPLRLVPSSTGYLNRRTGEIVHVYKSGSDAKEMGVPSLDNAVEGAWVEANPSEWVEIPKYDRHIHGIDQEEQFIAEFFRENGIDGELV